MRYRIRHGDQVMVMKGKESGKTGKILKVITAKGMVVIEKLNMVKRHTRPSDQYKQGGIIEKELPISIANVKILCEKCSNPVRTGWKFLQDGRKVRYCKKCNEVIDK
ncbi:MAG: 50S ribosomal protein L24 [Thermodesulfobacteriota bacterium]